jgi:hypothetical protein
LRNSVDWPTVWVTATEDAPALREKVAVLLAAEFPDIRLPGKGS